VAIDYRCQSETEKRKQDCVSHRWAPVEGGSLRGWTCPSAGGLPPPALF
jgi:hypothetical protein